MRILDLFCGEGGAAYGLLPFASHLTGVDIQPFGRKYPGHAFVQADVLTLS